MPKFFIDDKNINGSVIDVYGDDVSHIKRVLRLKPGDTVTLCDGKGTDYIVAIDSIEQNFVRTNIVSTNVNIAEPPIEVTIFQGVPKSDKMDLIIQKSVELGVKRVVPVMTDRTVVRIENKKDAENKTTRWQRIALEAAKQCNRGAVPEIMMPVTFAESFKLLEKEDLCLIPYEKEAENGLKTILSNYKDVKKVSVFIGPEGGFSEKEVETAIRANIRSVSLGPRILRTETAGLTVLSILMYELGDVGK
jgi:16S rRNA (uracil1498-N3)-methyltransferase